ncbi:MAG TPA: hypothetical protein VM939_12740 [Gemmatimonadaceae bacterium]|nr:hypothetical protein [Gemmatimonadaceae bacterium]
MSAPTNKESRRRTAATGTSRGDVQATDVSPEIIAEAQPRLAGLWAAAMYLLISFSLGFPAFSGKFLVGPNSDQFIAGYAFREFGASMLRQTGEFPLWNPYLFGGMPFVAAMHGDIFYPTFLLRMILPTDTAMTWGFIIHLFLAGLFTYYFLRATGFGFYGSLFGGVAYMMAGQLASLVAPGHDGKLFVSALFPLTLLLLTRGVRDGVKWSWGALAIAIGLAVLSPHPQLLQYMLLASGAYTIYLAVVANRRGGIERRDLLMRLAFALGAVFLGMSMGAIQYLPVREYVAWSPRAGGLADYAVATSYAWPLKEVFDAYLPQFSGMTDRYWGENGIHLHSDYIGVVTLLLAGAGLIRSKGDPKRGLVIFWAVTLLIAFLWALGGHTPFYRIPYAIVPGTKYFRAPATVFFVGALALSVLAAAGMERVLSKRVGRKYLFGWLGFAALVVLIGSIGGLTSIARSFAPAQAVDVVVANSFEVVKGAWRSFAFVLAAVIVILLYRRGKIPLAATGASLAIVAAVDSWSVMRGYWIFSPPANVLYAKDPAIEHLQRETQPARVLALELERSGFRDANLGGDGLMSHGIRTVLGYHGNQLGRYNQLLAKDQGYQQILNPNVWQLLNVKYLLTNTTEVHPLFPEAKAVLGPVKDAAGTTVYLYRIPGENPYAWVTPVIVKADDEAVLGTVLNPRFDVRRAALFATDAPVTGQSNVTALPEPLSINATVQSYAPGKVTITLDRPAPAGSALMVSENYYPGWTAKVDGRAAPIGRADFSLMGVQLQQAARTIELTFRSAPYERGKMVTLIALTMALLLVAGGMVMERRKVG